MPSKHGNYTMDEQWKMDIVASIATLTESHNNFSKFLDRIVKQNEDRLNQLCEQTSENSFTVEKLALSTENLIKSLDNYSQQMNKEVSDIKTVLHGDGKVNSKNPGLVSVVSHISGRWTAIVAAITFIVTIATEAAIKKITSMFTGHSPQ